MSGCGPLTIPLYIFYPELLQGRNILNGILRFPTHSFAQWYLAKDLWADLQPPVEWLIPLLQFKYKGVLKRPFGMKNAHLFIDPDGSEAEVLEKWVVAVLKLRTSSVIRGWILYKRIYDLSLRSCVLQQQPSILWPRFFILGFPSKVDPFPHVHSFAPSWLVNGGADC